MVSQVLDRKAKSKRVINGLREVIRVRRGGVPLDGEKR